MRVKIAELKTHLSHYVKVVRESGEPLEVCVREQPVAWLVAPAGRADGAEVAWRGALAETGLVLVQQGAGPLLLATPGCANDGRDLPNSVEVIRAERDW